jgi:MOSC domain-containing protein YiiM
VTVQHLSRKAKDPSIGNLRQVHLIHAELFDELAGRGFAVAPGEIGENVTTRGIALLDLPEGTILRLGDEARVRVVRGRARTIAAPIRDEPLARR